jgi:hypothetical protein
MRNKDDSSVYFPFIYRQHTEPSSDVTLCPICPISLPKLWRRLKPVLRCTFCRDAMNCKL